ncbi:MAG: hypothetical protein DLM68_01235 [Hyphomicrobiales bacterium]|nr:MAG: hypothetical protein DLM68_01235 [Hyphomicrobiales bacterium]
MNAGADEVDGICVRRLRKGVVKLRRDLRKRRKGGKTGELWEMARGRLRCRACGLETALFGSSAVLLALSR